MKAIMVMYDSLNRAMLQPYGCDWTKTPNFQRLAEHVVTFDNCYAGSLPCMPARRELHTGRYNFLHRSWGPLEPFDDSIPEILKNNDIYTHLVSDHTHYWEDGGATYHPRYTTWEINRGQEGDIWKGQVKNPEMPDTPFSGYFKMVEQAIKTHGSGIYRQDVVNRQYMDTEDKMPQALTFKNGLEFIDKNHTEDNWFLQIETFDPHEPFFASRRFKDMYPDPDYTGKDFDWPPYAPVNESGDIVRHGKKQYAALLSMCDYYLGQALDTMDKYDMWKDTMLIVCTDHGFLLGEHGWWAKSIMPAYNEIANTPLFVWDPRIGIKGERRSALVQTIDLAPTLLDFFGAAVPQSMQGKPLKTVIESDNPIRKTALFGYFGCQVNITDGEYVYMRGAVNPSNRPLNEYTLMPTHMKGMFPPKELNDIRLAEPFTFTKGCRTMKIINPVLSSNAIQFGTKLFNVKKDPGELCEIDDPETEVRLTNAMAAMMKENDAPAEQFERMGIPQDGKYTVEMLKKQQEDLKKSEVIDGLEGFSFEPGAFRQLQFVKRMIPVESQKGFFSGMKAQLETKEQMTVTKEFVKGFTESLPVPDHFKQMFSVYLENAGRTS
ncbi:MAG: sulfatase [Treponema sp.]|jgi:arylsulfatase A-like enzyme|nr:sulfatase [Treponema sp.]